MARTVRDARLDTWHARSKLRARKEPHSTRLNKGCHLGHRRPTHGRGGSWVARYRNKEKRLVGHYIGPADDFMDADGVTCFSFDQAQELARAWFHSVASTSIPNRALGIYSVADCIADYLTYIKAHKKSSKHLAGCKKRPAGLRYSAVRRGQRLRFGWLEPGMRMPRGPAITRSRALGGERGCRRRLRG